MHVRIIGGGVSGLTCGVELLRSGHEVSLWARDFTPHTTSDAAAAVWYPYKAFPIERVARWGAHAYRVLSGLAEIPASGVRVLPLTELRAEPSEDPWWVSAVAEFRHARADELPPGYADGYCFAAPVMDMSVYLPYLQHTFLAVGGTLMKQSIADIGEAAVGADAVVNCSGLGARELCGDQDIHAARGQVVRVRNPGLQQVMLDDDGPAKVAYIVPRQHDVVLGGVDQEYDERLTVDEEQTIDIMRRCALLDPRIDAIQPQDIVSVAVGLRPVRSAVRLEVEERGGVVVVHNYGHGGAGVTLSWGCAREVCDLIDEL